MHLRFPNSDFLDKLEQSKTGQICPTQIQLGRTLKNLEVRTMNKARIVSLLDKTTFSSSLHLLPSHDQRFSILSFYEPLCCA